MSEIRKLDPRAFGKDSLLDADRIRTVASRNIGFVAVGVADRIQKQLEIPEGGLGYVDMNSSARAILLPDQNGLLATSSLSGCTGVAAIARRLDGSSLVIISHYDPMSQSYFFTRQSNPINSQLFGFRHDAGSELVSPPRFLIAYDQSAEINPLYGDRSKRFDEWYHLDQIENTVGQLGDADVTFLPYQSGTGNTLATGRVGDFEGILWNGRPVDL